MSGDLVLDHSGLDAILCPRCLGPVIGQLDADTAVAGQSATAGGRCLGSRKMAAHPELIEKQYRTPLGREGGDNTPQSFAHKIAEAALNILSEGIVQFRFTQERRHRINYNQVNLP